MTDIDVDLTVLADIARSLDSGAEGIEALADGVPAGIDAGPMTGVIASMLSQIVGSAGNVSVSLSGAVQSVRLCQRYYESAEAESEAGLDSIRRSMQP